MGHDKLRKFAENESFSCLLQPSSTELLSEGYFHLKDHEVKGKWSTSMFDSPRPIVLELGCGKGEYTIDLSQRMPQCNYIGVDIKGARLWKGAKYAHENNLGNVAFLRTRIEFINAFFASSEVSQIWLTFSDPQMKSENSRLTSPLFLERYARFLKPGGLVHLKTDSMFLHQYTKAVVQWNKLPLVACTEDLYATAPQDLCMSGEKSALSEDAVRSLYEVQTFYEKMFLEQGYKITYLCFRMDGEKNIKSPEDFDAAYWREAEGPRRSFAHQPSPRKR